MSNLKDHARRELKSAGLFDEDSDYGGMLGDAVIELVEKFAEQGHSGFSAQLTLQLFGRVARFKPLGPITSDPDEWMEVGETAGGQEMWQNRRQSSCFSHDGGKTYYDIDEQPAWWRRMFRWTGAFWTRRGPVRRAVVTP